MGDTVKRCTRAINFGSGTCELRISKITTNPHYPLVRGDLVVETAKDVTNRPLLINGRKTNFDVT